MGEKINELRKSLNLTIEAFAKELKYSVSAVTKIIYNEREPSKNFFRKLKRRFPEIDMNIFFE